MGKKRKILFVCLGNICRSSAAQTIMQKLVDESGRGKEFEIDSAGLISFHRGEQADPRMRQHARRRGLNITHTSRPITTDDFMYFDVILGMDDSNIDRLMRLSPSVECDKKVKRMTDYSQRLPVDHVPDPYYGGASGFEQVLDILEDACEGLLASLT